MATTVSRWGWRLTGLTGLIVSSVGALLASIGTDGDLRACTAIGYSSVLRVEVEDAASRADRVRLCADEQCSTPDPDTSPVRVTSPGSRSAQSSDTDQLPSWAGQSAPVEDGVATIAPLVDLGPGPIDVEVLDVDGAVLVREDGVPVVLLRVGGSRQCGGPMEATVRVIVPD